MSSTPMEQILMQRARRHAPLLTQRPPASVVQLATELATYGVLVIPTENGTTALVNEMVSLYGSFYRVLTEALFPSLTTIHAEYADENTISVIVIEAHCLPVIVGFSQFITPYIATHQRVPVNAAEVQGIIGFLLDELEAVDLPAAKHRQLQTQGVQYIGRMLQMPMRQRSLTEFASAYRQQIAPLPPEPPELPRSHTPPPPETPKAPPPPPEAPKPNKPFSSDIPIFFDADPNAPMPPVPRPPGMK